MPPKPKKDVPGKKVEEKKKTKVIEDKTFGLKNKKGGKQQKFIKVVQTQVQHGDAKTAKLQKENLVTAKAKDAKALRAAELNLLFKPVDQKVPKGVDPKSMLCAYFKQGNCGKGSKCKFSHDLNVERKSEKRSVYADADGEEDSMDTWDEKKLEEVVNQKHGESNLNKPATSIICKYFLEAVENNKYGWFWACPNGEGCHYKHVLPPGFVLKRDKKKDDNEEKISLEELIETERASLNSSNLTKITLETFMKWKDRKRREKIVKRMKETDKKKSEFKDGKLLGISGRELFEFNPDIGGDDDEGDEFVYVREQEEDEDEVEVKELTLESLAESATFNDAPTQRPADTPASQGTVESSKLDEAACIAPDPDVDTEAAIAAAMSAVNGLELAGDAPIDENLFDGEDLDFVEDELEELELSD